MLYEIKYFKTKKNRFVFEPDSKPSDKELLSKLFVYSKGESEATKPIPIANSDKEKCWLNVILQTFLFTGPMCGFLKTWRDVFVGRINKAKDGGNYSLPLSQGFHFDAFQQALRLAKSAIILQVSF